MSRKELFESANYKKLIELYSSNPNELDSYLIGAMVFVAREREAREIVHSLTKPRELAEAYFFLLLSSVRALNYTAILKDLRSIIHNYQLERHSQSKFYLHQALGLIRYYRGEFEKSERQTDLALKLALSLKSDYFCMIANDLNAHALCMREKYGQGLKQFEDSVRFAKKIRNNSNISVIDLSILNYRISSGTDLKQAESKLLEWMASIEPQDYFTKTNALLLNAKLNLLKGDFKSAERNLFEVSAHVYRNNHGRQILEYNLLMAQLSLILNRPERALPLIRTSLQLCQQGHDLYFQLRFKELEYFAALKDEFSSDLKDEIQALAIQSGRKPRLKFPALLVSEEIANHHLDSFTQGALKRTEKLEELRDKSLLGLVIVLYKDHRENFIDWRLTKRELLIFSNHKLTLISGLTSNQMELINLLTSRLSWTKEEIVESFWRIKYDSFLHDNKVYITLKRLRERISDEVVLFELQRGKVIIEEFFQYQEVQKTRSNLKSLDNENSNELKKLNMRQISWMQDTPIGDCIRPSDYAKQFKISRNTCSRDLSELEKMGIVIPIGRGPGRFYRRCEKSSITNS